jgi:DNA-directed RNA polymerase specialized sigma24 family protein
MDSPAKDSGIPRLADSEDLLDAEALADAYYQEVLRLGWRLTGSREHGEDIAQEVFLHLHRRGIKLRADGFPLAYLRQMAARRSYKLMKSFSPEALPEDEQSEMAAPAPPATTWSGGSRWTASSRRSPASPRKPAPSSS